MPMVMELVAHLMPMVMVSRMALISVTIILSGMYCAERVMMALIAMTMVCQMIAMSVLVTMLIQIQTEMGFVKTSTFVLVMML